MKKLYTYTISIATVFVLLCSHGLFAQPIVTVISNGQIEDCTEIFLNQGVTENTVNTIVEEDYPYLKNLSCLKNNYFADRWKTNFRPKNFNQDNVTHYVVKSRGINIEMEATYDRKGNLIEATLINKDTQIPIPILRFIYSDDEFDGWTMVTNEKIVKNFDPYQTEYKVTLTDGKEEQVLHFREQGESIAFLN